METEGKYTPPEAQTQAQQSMENWRSANLPPKAEQPDTAGAQKAPDQQIQDFWAKQGGEIPLSDQWQYNADLHKVPFNDAAIGVPSPAQVGPEISADQAPIVDRFATAAAGQNITPEENQRLSEQARQQSSGQPPAEQGLTGHRSAEAVAVAEQIIERPAATEAAEQRIPEGKLTLPGGVELSFKNVTQAQLEAVYKALGIDGVEMIGSMPVGAPKGPEQASETVPAAPEGPVQKFQKRVESKLASLDAANPQFAFDVRKWINDGVKGIGEWGKGLKEDAVFSAFANKSAKEILKKWPGLLEDLEGSTENVQQLREVLGRRQDRLGRNRGLMQKLGLGRFSDEGRAVGTAQKELQNEQNVWRDRAIRSEQTRIQAARLVKQLVGMSRLNPSLRAVATTYIDQLKGFIDQHDQLVGRRPAAEVPPVAAVAPAAPEAPAAAPTGAPAAETTAPAPVAAAPAAAEAAAGRPAAVAA